MISLKSSSKRFYVDNIHLSAHHKMSVKLSKNQSIIECPSNITGVRFIGVKSLGIGLGTSIIHHFYLDETDYVIHFEG